MTNLGTWAELDESRLAEARTKYGRIERLQLAEKGSDGLHFVYVRLAGRPEFREFRAAAEAGKDRTIALENLVKRCLVHPTAEEFDAHLNRFPALGVTFGGLVLELAGASDSAEKKTV